MKYAITMLLAWSSTAFAGMADRLPPEAYVARADQEMARSGKGMPCTYEEVSNGVKAIASRPTALCVKMLPERRFVGLWRAAFEGSRFCPAPAKTCDHKTPGELIWLSNYPGRPHGGLYRVEFFGRKTMYKGPYGHFGVFDQEVDVDRMVSMKEIEPPPFWWKKSELVKQWKACEAAKACKPDWNEINKMKD